MTTAETPSRDHGFTLVEILVAMALATVVLLATLQALDVFTKSAGRQTRITDANSQVRSAVDRVVNDLRGAAIIRTAASTDLVYSVAETTGTRTERLCVSSASVLYRSTSTTSTSPGTTCGTVGTGWTQATVATVPATSATGFTYDGATSSATPTTVKNVGLTVGLDNSSNGVSGSSVLRTSATLRRAAGTLPVTDGDINASCNSSGALLSLNVAASGGLGLLGITYTTTGGVLLGTGTSATPLQIPKGVTGVIATITDAAGVTNTLQKTIECS